MNAKQRKVLTEIIDKLSEYHDLVKNCESKIVDIKYEEKDKYDNLPDSLRDSEKGEKLQNVVICLDCAIRELDDVYSSIYGFLNYLNEAIE